MATSYRLDGDVVEVDASTFERLLTEASAARDRSADREAAALVDQALEQWSGPALDEFATASWAAAEAHRLNELRITAREQRAELAIDVGRVEGALVAELERLAAEHPHR